MCCSFHNTKNKNEFYRGENCTRKYSKDIREHAMKKFDCNNRNVTIDRWGDEWNINEAVRHKCKKEFDDDYDDDNDNAVRKWRNEENDEDNTYDKDVDNSCDNSNQNRWKGSRLLSVTQENKEVLHMVFVI